MLPAAWFPRPWISLILLVIPATWIVRRVVTGRWSVRTRYDLAFGGLLLILPLTLLPVVQWDASLPKLLTLLAGAGMVYALANSLRDRKRLMIAIYAVRRRIRRRSGSGRTGRDRLAAQQVPTAGRRL